MTRLELLQIARPILFSTDMVRAILDGRKTVTRRAIKLKYSNTHHEMFTNKCGTRLIEIQDDVEGETFGKNEDGTTWHKLRGYTEPKPPYKKGQYLYVRETWDNLPVDPEGCYCGYDRYYYRADGDLRPEGWQANWKPSIHMSKGAARIFLRVTDVRAERLMDMDKVDAIKEGIDPRLCVNLAHALAKYMKLWDSVIHRKDLDKYGWDANPWVWVVEFKRVEVES